MKSHLIVALLSALLGTANAHGIRRQLAPTPTDASAVPLSALTSGMPTRATTPVTATFGGGDKPPVTGVPPLPTPCGSWNSALG